MKKSLFLIQLTAIAVLFSPLSYADDDDWDHHGHHYDHHYDYHDYDHHYDHHDYYPQPQIHYYPQPQIHYYPQPQVNYYQRQAQYSADPRSHQGLAGGRHRQRFRL